MESINKFLINFLDQNKNKIDSWLLEKSNSKIIYASVDLRCSDFKIAPVDFNFFPAGFNNLNICFDELATEQLKNFCSQYGKKILLIIENYDRNLKYLESILRLKKFLSQDFEVKIANLINFEKKIIKVNEEILEIEPIIIKDNFIIVDENFLPDFIICNNDLTSCMPKIFENIKQKIFPNPHCGWFNRKKTNYFVCYQHICNDFAKEFGIDPWLISAFFTKVNGLDFKNRIGLEALAEEVEKIQKKTQEKYLEYGINKRIKPYCFIKANNGTYGMGVISVQNAEEIFNLNKSNRSKMHKVKHGIQINEVLVQEGIPTIEQIGKAKAESVLYMINSTLVGGFARCNEGRGPKLGLNVPSSFFTQQKNQEIFTEIKYFFATLADIAAQEEIKTY